MPAPRTVNQTNQRKSARHPGNETLLCGVRGEQGRQRWAARVHDVSATGIGLLLPNAVARGTLLNLRFWGRTGATVRRRYACVMHVTPQGQGCFIVGCALDSKLSARELQALR
jgi:hypothetical protein